MLPLEHVAEARSSGCVRSLLKPARKPSEPDSWGVVLRTGIDPRVGFAVALLLLALPLLAEATGLRDHPGFVDFERPAPLEDDDLEIHVSVKGPMIQLIAGASRESDPALADVLSELEAVEVWVYNVPEGARSAIRTDIRQIARELGASGWDEAIAIRIKSARGHVFLRLDGETAAGIAAMYFDDEENEAVYVNIIGRVDPAQIGRLAGRFNLDLLNQAAAEAEKESGDARGPEENP